MENIARKTNRHPVDELAEVRAEVRRLGEREQELREMIMGGSCSLEGDGHVAEIQVVSRGTLDRDKLALAFGKSAVDKCVVKRDQTWVRVKAR